MEKNTNRKVFWGHLAGVIAMICVMVMTAGCGDKYSKGRSIEGVFYPNGCVQIEGREDGWLSLSTVNMNTCVPVHANELGVMTYGWEVRNPGLKLEVARLQVSGSSIYIAVQTLQQGGRFEYREHSTWGPLGSTPSNLVRSGTHFVVSTALIGLFIYSLPAIILVGLLSMLFRR